MRTTVVDPGWSGLRFLNIQYEKSHCPVSGHCEEEWNTGLQLSVDIYV